MNVSFSDVLFDSEARTVTRSGQPLHLSPKAFDLLAVLIAAGPRVVRKEEIVDTLWPDVVVEEANVRNLIAEIRAAIGDRDGRCIRTLPRVGYAFCASVHAGAERSACTLSGPDRDFTLTPGEHLIGRAGECAVVVRVSGVSRHHAKITISRDGDALLEDLGSKNGTFLGESRISNSVVLHDGDRIRLGAAAALVFRSSADVKSTTTAAAGR